MHCTDMEYIMQDVLGRHPSCTTAVQLTLVYRATPISLAYWKLELGHREKPTQLPVSERNGSSLID